MSTVAMRIAKEANQKLRLLALAHRITKADMVAKLVEAEFRHVYGKRDPIKKAEKLNYGDQPEATPPAVT